MMSEGTNGGDVALALQLATEGHVNAFFDDEELKVGDMEPSSCVGSNSVLCSINQKLHRGTSQSKPAVKLHRDVGPWTCIFRCTWKKHRYHCFVRSFVGIDRALRVSM